MKTAEKDYLLAKSLSSDLSQKIYKLVKKRDHAREEEARASFHDQIINMEPKRVAALERTLDCAEKYGNLLLENCEYGDETYMQAMDIMHKAACNLDSAEYRMTRGYSDDSQ